MVSVELWPYDPFRYGNQIYNSLKILKSFAIGK
jgi:hypothetical protein